MALGKKYYIDYKSMANEDFTLEIWVEGYTSSATEINLGGSGPEIQYETSNQEKFSYILASSLDVPFMVENTGHADFIQDLRDGTLEEKDVYVHLFNSRDTTRPLWSGFLIMDLAAQEDVSFPYEVKLTAIDGLSLLKDQPFVRDTNLDTGNPVEFPYDVNDVYWNNYTKITNWIEIILAKTGSAISTGMGLSTSYTYKTSINWYNSEMPSTGQADDPLFWTQCKMNSLYDRDENGIYTPKSTYDVLEALCKNWGMRCVYWHHTFHFVQIAEYEANETGTANSPINIPTREYYYNGGRRLDQAHIGEQNFGQYDLQFENVTNVNNAGLQKLAGTQYDFYAPIKRVIGNFQVLADENQYQGFPELDQTTDLHDIIYSKEITTYTDASDMDGFYCQIPLIFTNIQSQSQGTGLGGLARVLDMKLCFSIRARQEGTTPYTKMLTESGGTLSWSTYTAPTGSNGVPDDMINKNITYIPNGTSQRVVFDSGSYNNGIIPTDPAFTGAWEFEFFTYTDATGVEHIDYHGQLRASSNNSLQSRAGDPETVFDYSDVFDSNNNFTGIFAQIAAGSIGNNSIATEYTTSTSDSYTVKIEDLYWGDSPLIDNASALRVWNGSTFVKADSGGDWGKGTLSGTDNFNKLLATEIIKCQHIASQRMNVTSALSETDKLIGSTTRIKMVNPVGRLKDINSEKYVFLSGTYNTLRDQWNGVWFQFTYDNGLVVTTADPVGTGGPHSGPVLGGGAQGSSQGNGAQMSWVPWGATDVSQRISAGAITSINIEPIGEEIIYSGDRIYITDDKSGQTLEFEVSADVARTDTTISVVSNTITEDIREGSIVGIDNKNLFQQYQRKTEGSVGGMPITSDSIGKYVIKSGDYYMVGVDTLYVKILPTDFMVNDDASSPDITPAVFGDGTNTGVSVENTAQELIATVNIPSGTTATEVYIWGSNTTKSVEVYKMDINANGKGSTVGTGVTDGTAISIGTIASSDTNYLMIKVLVSSTNHRIWGGKVTLTQN